MSFSRIHRVPLLLSSILVGVALPSTTTAQGQSGSSVLSAPARPAATPDRRQNITVRRSRRTDSEIDRLKAEMGSLHALLIEQQQAMSAMQKQLADIQAGRIAAVQFSPAPAAQVVSSAAKASLATAGGDIALDSTMPASDAAAYELNTAGIAGSTQPSTSKIQPSEPNLQPSSNNAISRSSSSAQAKRGLLAGWGDDHAFIRNESGSFETDFLGYSQLDFRGYSAGNHPPTHPPNTFIVRRARMAIEGKVDTYFEWRVEGDFADTNSTLLRDFYVNIHRIDEFVMRFGQTRQPFSQEEMRPDNFQEFVERSLVNNLAPSRSPGVMAYGKLGDGILVYQTGAFNGKGLLAQNNNGTPDTALRLRFNPWRRSDNFWIKGLIFGGAYSQGRNFNGQSIMGVTPSQITFFQPDTVNGRLYRANGELTWLLGPAALRAEYDQSNQLRENLGPRGTNLPGVIAKGYMVQFSYMLTGENQPDIGYVVPKRNLFDPGSDGRTGLGAWQLKFRYDNLQIIDGTPKSNRAHTFYFGPNWYMNKYVRYLLDFGIEQFNHPANALRPGQRFFVVLTEIQLQL
jgi:phosphate-selective porin OprO/OprP